MKTKKKAKRGKFVVLWGAEAKVSHLYRTIEGSKTTFCGLWVGEAGDKFHTKRVGRLCGNCARVKVAK